MNALRMMAWLQDHPGVVSLVSKLPKLDKETGTLLVEFLQKVVSYDEPEEYLKDVLKRALKEPIPTTVEIVRVLPRK